jgi:hypothetical protein
MARQKVKGTGHKQPADAKTEPNFYEMRPAESAVSAQRGAALHNFSAEDRPLQLRQQLHEEVAPLWQELPSAAAAAAATSTAPARRNTIDPYASTQAWNYPQPAYGSVPDSPASPGLHGAAHLLQNIASGYVSNLRMPTDSALGPPATGTGDVEEGEPTPSQAPTPRRPASFLQPRLSSPSPFSER